MKARRARPSDVASIHRLIEHYAAAGLLLPRAADNIAQHIGHFLVLDEAGRVVGCAALEPYTSHLAEVRSLAVEPGSQGCGHGARLLRFALAVARRRRTARVFAVTHAPEFFLRQGFELSTRHALPEKIARDCLTCPKRRTCRLDAVVATLLPERVALPVLAATPQAVAAR